MPLTPIGIGDRRVHLSIMDRPTDNSNSCGIVKQKLDKGNADRAGSSGAGEPCGGEDSSHQELAAPWTPVRRTRRAARMTRLPVRSRRSADGHVAAQGDDGNGMTMTATPTRRSIRPTRATLTEQRHDHRRSSNDAADRSPRRGDRRSPRRSRQPGATGPPRSGGNSDPKPAECRLQRSPGTGPLAARSPRPSGGPPPKLPPSPVRGPDGPREDPRSPDDRPTILGPIVQHGEV